jgi:hypothetical protein
MDNISKSTLIKAVRQVLTNLGLTREFARAEMSRMVAEFCAKYVESDQFKRLVERCVIQHVRTHGYEFNCNVQKAVAEVLTKKLTIGIKDDVENGAS